MLLYSQRPVNKGEKGFGLVSSLWKAFRGAEPWGVGLTPGQLSSSPCLFFSRPTCPCCSENCCTALGPPSRPHPNTWLSMNTSCSTQVSRHLQTLLSCSWKCMETERGPVQRGEQRRARLSLFFWKHSEHSLCSWKKENLITVVLWGYGLRSSKVSFALSQHEAAECFLNL